MAKAWLYTLALFFLNSEAWAVGPAVVCPQMTAGWALQWQPTQTQTITSASYDSTTQYLYIVFNYRTVHAFSNVPIGIIISLSYTQNPLAIYNASIAPNFTELTLNATTHCPV